MIAPIDIEKDDVLLIENFEVVKVERKGISIFEKPRYFSPLMKWFDDNKDDIRIMSNGGYSEETIKEIMQKVYHLARD